MNRKLLFAVLFAAFSGNQCGFSSLPLFTETNGRVENLPDRISDHDFWMMIKDFSEPGGTFVSDNIISNEIEFQRVIPDVQRLGLHNVYVGVGPEHLNVRSDY